MSRHVDVVVLPCPIAKSLHEGWRNTSARISTVARNPAARRLGVEAYNNAYTWEPRSFGRHDNVSGLCSAPLIENADGHKGFSRV